MHKNHGTFCRSTGSHVSIPDAGKTTSKPKKQLGYGDFAAFNTDYSEFGGREMPSPVLPGSPMMRLANRYGQNEREPDMGPIFGPFGRRG